MAYTKIDNGIIRAKLKPTTKIVLITLMSYENKGCGYAYPSHKQIMNDTCIKDKKTLIKAIGELESVGYISKETIKGKGNKYFITQEVDTWMDI